jgi:hypothetical protein
MIILIGILSILGIVFILPGWLVANKRSRQSILLFTLPITGIIVWLFLYEFYFSQGSLANLSELFYIVLISIMAAYFKFFIFDRVFINKSFGLIIVFLIVIIVTFAFRIFMPVLPE